MKRILFLFVLVLGITTASFAQMSDEEVVKFAQQENAAGKDQNTIAKELLAKGVTQEQALRIRNKYMSSQNGTTSGKEKSSTESDRSRKSNGEDYSIALISDAVEASKSKIFGHDIFRSKDLSFEPNMNISTPVTYVLGPGDEVIMDIYGASQSSQTLKVSPDGNITVPKIGPIYVNGMTIAKAQSVIRAKVGVHYRGSNIKVTVGQTRSVMVNILGEVKNPGTYTLSAFASVFNALYLAGGITEEGTLRNIKVSRNGRVISRVDVYDYIINGKLTGNVMLHDNDVIIVGTYDALVNINGRVKRPMFYEMRKGESLKSLINYAGGFRGDAYTKNIRVERKDANGYTVKTVDEWDFSKFGMEDADEVYVDSVAKRFKNMVTVSGAVFHSGTYSISPECNTISSLVRMAGGVTEDANTNRAVLTRENPDRTRNSLTVDLAAILSGKAPDMTLQSNDVLIISSQWRMLYGDKVYVYGAVDKGGEFDYAKDMTLEDAITLAGGLMKDASLSNVEVSRMLIYTDETDTTYQRKSKSYTFSIKNGLIIDGETGFKLMPNDVVTVRVSPNYASLESVYIGGEVMFPGTYALSGSDRISDLVKRAGGLKVTASPSAAEFTRFFPEDERKHKVKIYELTSDSTITDSVTIKNIMKIDRYSLGINLVEAMKKPGSDADILLKGGDNLVIHKYNNTVTISGEVLYNNTVSYLKGKRNSYYLNQAGGVKRTGDKKNAYIIYADGQVSMLSKGKVKAGCEIVVPKKPKRDRSNTAQTASLILGGSSVLASVTAVLVNALK